MPRPLPSEWLPDVRGCCDTVVAALAAVVDAPQVAAVQSLVEAAMTGFTERFTQYRLASLEAKLRRKASRLHLERQKTQSLEEALRARSPICSPSHKKKLPSGNLPLGPVS
ncbi:MAG: hypothetical protein LBS56_09435 [Propionibacteriaceae bacterium]|nr:hypothetical protein [Propionibacteriaceae bacterium]